MGNTSSKRRPAASHFGWIIPGIDGVELCRRVRERTNELYTYIILLTAKDRKEDVVKAMDAGADEYIIKPPAPSELQARIRAGCHVIELDNGLWKLKKN